MRGARGLVWLLAGCTPIGAGPPTAIVVVLDGVRTDEFSAEAVSDLTGMSGEAYAAETWGTLAPHATAVRAAINTGVTITAPAHAAMLTGRMEAFGNFPVDAARGDGAYLPETPTIFEEARAQLGLSEDEVVFIANTEFLSPVTRSLYPGYPGGARYDLVIDEAVGAPVEHDEPMIDALLALLDTGPRLVVANLHGVDRAGHYGEGDAYIDGVATDDALVADLWRTLQSERPELVQNLLLVVTADHGRHRVGGDGDWHNHGDACTGCREVPLFLLGAAREDAELDVNVAGIDLAPTLAAHLGIDLPWGEGLPFVDAFDRLDIGARSGAIDLVRAGAHVALQAWRDDRDARSEILVDGARVSTPGVWAAEAPALVDTAEGARVCFRELDLATGADTLPWRPRCLAEGVYAWEDIGFPADTVGPFFRVAFAERAGRLWAAWPHNPNGIADFGEDAEVGLYFAAWEPGSGWTEPAGIRALFPTEAALVATERGLVAAVATNLGDPDYRYTRRIRLVPIDLSTPSADGLAVDTTVDITFAGLLGDAARVERPALVSEGDHVWLAALGQAPDGGRIVAAESVDGGNTWAAPVELPDAGTVAPNVSPAWDGERVVWVVVSEGAAALCRAAPTDAAAACVEVPSSRVQSFSVRDGVATVVVDLGVGLWGSVVVRW